MFNALNRLHPLDVIKIGVLVCILFLISFQKYKVFDEAGGDFEVYRQASREFLSGKNPYEYTVKSFEDPSAAKRQDTTKPREVEVSHGFAYLPGLLYIQTPLYILFEKINYPLQRLWRFPVLLMDLGTSTLLAIYFYKKGFLVTVLSVLAWSYSPFFLVRHSYTNYEPYSVFFTLLSLMLFAKNESLSAISFSLAVVFKTHPLILLPILLYDSKHRLKFLTIGALCFILVSLPFMKSIPTFITYIQGSLLVHGDRELQGRPLLSFLQYYTSLNFHQVSMFKIYVYTALFSGSIISLLMMRKRFNLYIAALISYAGFFVFTPVLSRTHVLWLIPVYLVGIHEFLVSKKNGKLLYVFLVILFYVFWVWYLYIWERGFRYSGDNIFL